MTHRHDFHPVNNIVSRCTKDGCTVEKVKRGKVTHYRACATAKCSSSWVGYHAKTQQETAA